MSRAMLASTHQVGVPPVSVRHAMGLRAFQVLAMGLRGFVRSCLPCPIRVQSWAMSVMIVKLPREAARTFLRRAALTHKVIQVGPARYGVKVGLSSTTQSVQLKSERATVFATAELLMSQFSLLPIYSMAAALLLPLLSLFFPLVPTDVNPVLRI